MLFRSSLPQRRTDSRRVPRSSHQNSPTRNSWF